MKYKEQDLLDSLKEETILEQLSALSGWDALTGMPQDSGHFRSEVDAYLAEKQFLVATQTKRRDMLAYFDDRLNELSDLGREIFPKVKKAYERFAVLPQKDYVDFNKTMSLAQNYWAQARQENQYAIFEPYLKQLIQYEKQFIPLWQKDEKTPYDVLLNQYEPGLTVEKLDQVFDTLKKGIMTLRKKIMTSDVEIDVSFLQRHITKKDQKQYALNAVQRLGYNLDKGRLDDTIHPFMEALNRDDARITTRWAENQAQMAILGIFHEAGHGLFEQNVNSKYDWVRAVLPISMSIHESQSLFNEVMIGRTRAFWRIEYPKIQKDFHGIWDDITFDQFYAAWMKTEATLIRTEADPLTYPLHIIIRYEIEKAIFNDHLDVKKIPELWREKYQEYLGLEVPDDLTGVLQDIHWAGGSFGYFPSYALGHLYAAQFYHAMSQQMDFQAIFESGDYEPIFSWRAQHIWQFGGAKDPADILKEATGEQLNPQYWLDFMNKIYTDIYQIGDN
ncbi:carboxypeptidase M32 [Leuconostoc fallax]|uniref:Metal-dependent carboxypeptidase n=1 Tax=Leuconostoc fallax TaxID=1251 RepID=A0A4R5N6X1_9LACO|nr:carboxypeptidase M32 [Leuconostoc fallax]MBU7455336.1 carboxypeptidase M32 [Leuconostoc fallax]TDG67555.1 hypothetical protein C5L23_001354 [Leuconostoc fallax]